MMVVWVVRDLDVGGWRSRCWALFVAGSHSDDVGNVDNINVGVGDDNVTLGIVVGHSDNAGGEGCSNDGRTHCDLTDGCSFFEL
jgi:hypothetical protein